jgi:hypothetical protein
MISQTFGVENLVDHCKKSAVQEMEMFLRNFAHVPDDKLTWTPAPASKSAIRIAAHTALYAGRFARMISERNLPVVDNLDEWLAARQAEEDALTSRQEIEAVFRKGTDEVLAALDSLTPDEIGFVLDSGQGFSISMSHLMTLPGWHATLHCGQIDFLQTCWGDQEIHLS